MSGSVRQAGAGSSPSARLHPVGVPAASAGPLIPPTNTPGIDALTDVINKTAEPFLNAPPAAQGAVGYVAQGLNGLLGLVGAPAELIDTAVAVATAPLAKLFPALPAATMLCAHLGTPHTHMHPPSLVPPAPPIPLPSMGVLMASGCASVLINGLPAARCGDLGLGLTCGSFAPPFEVMTGSSSVFIGGARAARLGDLTRHCNPASALSTFDKVMAVAGGVAGVLDAVALGVEAGALNAQAASTSGAEAAALAAESAGKSLGAAMAAAQAAADAAAFALQALCGKDPAGPPGIGMVIGPPGNVLIGGMPMPALGDMAMDRLCEKIGQLRPRRRRASQGEPHKNGTCGRAGEPVDVTTGANFNSYVDFVSRGLFRWVRHYSSARASQQGPLGWGFRHEYQRELRVRLHCCTYVDEEGHEIEFPRLRRDESEVRQFGYVLRRLDSKRYSVSYRDRPTLEFQVEETEAVALLRRMSRGGAVLEFEYDEARRLVEVTERAPGVQERYRLSYDSQGHLLQVAQIRPAGAPHPVAAYIYDQLGRLVSTRDALGGTERYAYDAAHRLTEMSDRRGYTFRWRYDEQGRCTWTEGEDGQWPSTLEYLPERGCTRVTEGPDEVWTYVYETDGTITRIVDPYGGVLRRERNAEGRVVREIDSGGRVTELLYDSDGAHYARQDRFGNLSPPQIELPNPPNPLEHRLPETPVEWFLGGVMEPSPDAALGAPGSLGGFVPEHVHPVLAATLRLRTQGAPPTLPLPDQTFDALGRLVAESDGLGRHQEWQYDSAGNQIKYRDRDGSLYQRQITSWNLIGAEIDPLGNATYYSYSPSERVTRVVDPKGNVSEYDYDAKDRLCRVYRHGVLREEYRYDVGDRLIAKLDGQGRTLLECEPHENGFPKVERLASGEIHEFDYDAHGRFTRAATRQHDVRLRFSADGRRLLDERNGCAVEHRYSHEGLAHMSVLSRFATSYQHEPGLVRVTDPTGGAHRFVLEAPGLVVRRLANGTTEVQQFDGEGRLTGRVSWGPAGSLRRTWSVRYSYNAEGDLLRVQDSARGETEYRCDAAHRLIGERTPSGELLEYVLDAAGNVLRKPGLSRAEVGTGNLLRSANGEIFSYDHRNHVVARSSIARGTVRYVHDSLDQLVRIEDERGESWTAEYDALGRRVRCGRGEQQTEFYWDGDRIAAEVAPGGRLRVYVYAGSEALLPYMFVDYDSVDAPPEQGRTYFVFHDQVGLPLHIEDDRGRVVWWARRVDPYGTVEALPGAEVEYALRWPGHYYDSDTGLHYNRFRYYDPRLGRYLQSDPLGLAGGLNLYAYAPNPTITVDLLGLEHRDDPPPDSDGPTPRRKREDINDPSYQKRIKEEYGNESLITIKHLVALGLKTAYIEKTLSVAKKADILHKMNKMINSKKLRNPEKLPKFIQDLWFEIKNKEQGLRAQFEEAYRRIMLDHEVAIGGCTYDPDIEESGQADVIDYTAKEAIQMKVIHGASEGKVLEHTQMAVAQIGGIRGEYPPINHKRIVDIRFIPESPHPLNTATREQLLNELRGEIKNLKYLYSEDGSPGMVRITNKQGVHEFNPGELEAANA